jgi:maltose O-acetyltransferase
MPTDREKMLAGDLYDPLDAELVASRDRARDLCQDLNATREGDRDERRRILRALLGTGGDDAWIQPPFFCDYGSNIHLGRGCFFNFNCIVLDVCEVRIGSFCLFGPAVQVYTPMHPTDFMQRRPDSNDIAKVAKEFGKPVTIGDDVWIGGGAIICPGVTIGSRTVIGAGSVVTRDIPDDVFAAGNPCHVIRQLDQSTGTPTTRDRQA